MQQRQQQQQQQKAYVLIKNRFNTRSVHNDFLQLQSGHLNNLPNNMYI